MIQPRMMQLRRLVIGEAGRFPELGRLFYDSGPGRTIDTLAATFENLAARGALRLEEPAAGPVAVTLACVWGGDRFGELARFFAGVGGALRLP